MNDAWLALTPIVCCAGHETVTVKDVLKYDYQTANRLHELDRVHTYASFFIADLSL